MKFQKSKQKFDKDGQPVRKKPVLSKEDNDQKWNALKDGWSRFSGDPNKGRWSKT